MSHSDGLRQEAANLTRIADMLDWCDKTTIQVKCKNPELLHFGKEGNQWHYFRSDCFGIHDARQVAPFIDHRQVTIHVPENVELVPFEYSDHYGYAVLIGGLSHKDRESITKAIKGE